MNDQNDDAQNFALMVLAGVVAVVPRVTLGGADAREARRVEMRLR